MSAVFLIIIGISPTRAYKLSYTSTLKEISIIDYVVLVERWQFYSFGLWSWHSGDHDLIIPNTATQGWIGKLNLTIVNDWRPWLVDGQVAG